jgi:hypothetical protein
VVVLPDQSVTLTNLASVASMNDERGERTPGRKVVTSAFSPIAFGCTVLVTTFMPRSARAISRP